MKAAYLVAMWIVLSVPLGILAGKLIAGCAGRQIPRSDRIPEEQHFWHGCQEVVPANEDGFQHFICIDVHSKRWEVLIRREGK